MDEEDKKLYNDIMNEICNELGIAVQPLKEIAKINNNQFHVDFLKALRAKGRRLKFNFDNDVLKVIYEVWFAAKIIVPEYCSYLEKKKKGLSKKILDEVIKLESNK